MGFSNSFQLESPEGMAKDLDSEAATRAGGPEGQGLSNAREEGVCPGGRGVGAEKWRPTPGVCPPGCPECGWGAVLLGGGRQEAEADSPV